MTEKKENWGIPCEIVQDLLPLYHDGVVSEKTKTAIQAHMKECPVCSKEYDALCKDFPVPEKEISTQKRFANLVRGQKRRQRVLMFFSALLACVVLIAAYWGQMQFLVSYVPGEEISVHRVYRYKTDEGYKFFVLYTLPGYSHTTGAISVKKGEDGDTLVMNIKKPLIDSKKGCVDSTWVYDCGYGSGEDGTLVFQDFSALEFGGEVVWQKEINGADQTPDYVYAYEEFNHPGGQVEYWSVSSEDGYIEAGYREGYFIRWDLDGNILYDSRIKQ